MTKVLPFKIPITDSESFIIRKDTTEYFYPYLHNHEEIQITLILESSGAVCIGDYVGRYEKYDLFIIGSNCSHVFKNDQTFVEVDIETNPRAISIYLGKYFYKDQQIIIPELVQIQEFLKKAGRIYRTNLRDHDNLIENILSLSDEQGTKKYVGLISVLDGLLQLDNYQFLMDRPFDYYPSEEDGERLKKVYDYVLENSHQKISVDEVADIANLSPNSFCRFFKKSTSITFADFLKTIRVNNAAKLLVTSDKSVSQIAEITGYHNMSNFNRQFLELKNLTPSSYRKQNLKL